MSGDYRLFLDDVRDPPSPEWEVVRTYDNFRHCIERRGCPQCISFDHDLGPVEQQPSGMDCAKWFCNWILDNPKRLHSSFVWCVHSMNPAGSANIGGLMTRFMRYIRSGE